MNPKKYEFPVISKRYSPKDPKITMPGLTLLLFTFISREAWTGNRKTIHRRFQREEIKKEEASVSKDVVFF